MALAATARQSQIQKFFQSWAILATEKYLPRKTPCLPLATKKNLHCTSAMSSATGDVPPAVPPLSLQPAQAANLRFIGVRPSSPQLIKPKTIINILEKVTLLNRASTILNLPFVILDWGLKGSSNSRIAYAFL